MQCSRLQPLSQLPDPSPEPLIHCSNDQLRVESTVKATEKCLKQDEIRNTVSHGTRKNYHLRNEFLGFWSGYSLQVWGFKMMAHSFPFFIFTTPCHFPHNQSLTRFSSPHQPWESEDSVTALGAPLRPALKRRSFFNSLAMRNSRHGVTPLKGLLGTKQKQG